ncbi:hypothetical protein M409DRAFT_59699 [Zasmidium cellare ATCC 36951]|uniref:Thioesterase domain-containing protein n=1 Tax=Zasmidium cellare ATCC 36951 TaxID=1080233 RepID=A0A6A6C0S3_ZASCE|nr:uncharacterized protein M409DRAFT_59699 [Zasmidium cellare ATCC 36951]KAF2160657.1 hypothetical protein M409DRAFT_59699 [Zasmidium cellare ATCC 36951]
MTPSDTVAPLLQIPWIARQLNQPNTICVPPTCRAPKPDLEDSLIAETLKTPRTLTSVVCFYTQPPATQPHVPEVNIVMTMGDGMNGHPDTLHGGITAMMIDEGCGIYQGVNRERENSLSGSSGAESSYTGELKVRYERPIRTPGAVVVRARRVRREGRKEWILAEVRQWVGSGEGEGEGDEVVCARGEALFIVPRGGGKIKL